MCMDEPGEAAAAPLGVRWVTSVAVVVTLLFSVFPARSHLAGRALL